MLFNEIRQIKSGKSELKSFGITIGSAFLIFAGFVFFQRHSVPVVLLMLAGFFYFFGSVFPAFLNPIQKAWMILALLLGWMMTRVILSVVFYAILTPTAYALRLFKTKFLDTAIEPNKQTYWVKTDPAAHNPQSVEQQF